MTDHTTGRNLFVRTGPGPRDAGVREIYRKMQWQLRAGGLALQGG